MRRVMHLAALRSRLLLVMGLPALGGAQACRNDTPRPPSTRTAPSHTAAPRNTATPSPTAPPSEAPTPGPGPALPDGALRMPPPTPPTTFRRDPIDPNTWNVTQVSPPPLTLRGSCPSGIFCSTAPVVQTPPGAQAPPPPAPGVGHCPAAVQPPASLNLGTRGGLVTFDADASARESALRPGACCYAWVIQCPGGRPLVAPDTGRPLTAAPVPRNDWSGPAPEALPLDGYDPAALQAAAHRWLLEAAYEHASVASFARASLVLLSLGAPASLVRDCHQAALDEVGHAQACYALATRYGAPVRGPGPLPLGSVSGSLPDAVGFALETLRDGCINESVAAALATERAAACRDPAARAALVRIAAEEESHAALAWSTLVWLCQHGGDPVRDALRTAARTLPTPPEAPEAAVLGDAHPAALAALGVAAPATEAAVHRAVLREVVGPCLDALLEPRA